MNVYSLIALPLGAAAIASAVRRWPLLAVALGLATTLGCTQLAFSLPLGTVTAFLGQEWTLDVAGRMLLAFLYIGTAILLAVSALAHQAESFVAPALASVGLLSATVLLRSLLLSVMLLPVALVVLVLTAAPPFRSVAQGASRFLTWTTLPILCVPVLFMLLERFASLPHELALVDLASWLLVPPAILWLTLFPFDGATRLWTRDGLSLGPVFLWAVKDPVVIYILLILWQRYPMLRTENTTATLGIAGLLTAVSSGVLAFAQWSPSAVVACAAMSELGIAVQGVTAGSEQGVLSGLFLLVSRAVAVLLASSALAMMKSAVAKDSESKGRPVRWRTLLLCVAFFVGVLALAGVPPLGGFFGRGQVYATLPLRAPYLSLAWLSASAGIVLGLVRAGWSLWHTKVQSPPGRLGDLPLLLVLGLLLVCLWIGFRPVHVVALLSDWFGYLLPTLPPAADCIMAAHLL